MHPPLVPNHPRCLTPPKFVPASTTHTDPLPQSQPVKSSPLDVMPEGKLKGSGCALGWQLDRYARDDMTLFLLPPRPSDLLQNCDLPAPLNLFPPTPSRTADAGAAQAAPPNPPFLRKMDHEGAEPDGGGGNTQNALLKALQLSQTRAREAEKVAAALGEKNRKLTSLLVEESLMLYAHRQWLRLLEAENCWLRRETGTRGKEGGGGGGPDRTRYVVVAACLGIAGLGLVAGYRLLS